jgi:hypothetical protein
MAAGRIPAPGTKFGPCIDPCEHTDCAATRKDAASQCHFCNTEIGYEKRFYIEATTRQLVHAACLEDNTHA